MRRREFVMLSATVAWPFAARAQQKKSWRVGFLGDGPRGERAPTSLEPFLDGLRELGYAVGENLLIEERWSEGNSNRLGSLAAELVGLKVDVIVTHGVPAATAT